MSIGRWIHAHPHPGRLSRREGTSFGAFVASAGVRGAAAFLAEVRDAASAAIRFVALPYASVALPLLGLLGVRAGQTRFC